jgi:hypothetical protein
MDVNTLAQFAAQKTRRPLQATLDLFQMLGVEGREEDLGMRVIRRQFDIGQADHANARILQFSTNQIGEVAAHLLRDPFATLETLLLHYSERATSWISNTSS